MVKQQTNDVLMVPVRLLSGKDQNFPHKWLYVVLTSFEIFTEPIRFVASCISSVSTTMFTISYYLYQIFVYIGMVITIEKTIFITR